MAAYLEELIVTDRNLVINNRTFSLDGGGYNSGRSLGTAKVFKLRCIT
jgi:hypothetical protein